MKRAFPSRALPSLLFLLLAAGMLPLLQGCTPPEPEGEAEPPAEEITEAAGPAYYQVRAQVVELPDPEDPLSGFYLHHEAIDDFRTMDGEIEGMDSMTMPFPVADEVSLEDLAEGDVIAFTLRVDWDGDPAYEVTAVEKLEAGTELEYRQARPGGGEGNADDG